MSIFIVETVVFGLSVLPAFTFWTWTITWVPDPPILRPAIVAAALSRFPLPWLRFRMLRWIAGAVVVAALAHIGHAAAMKAGVSVGIHSAASFAAVCAAALTALFGAYFAAKR